MNIDKTSSWGMHINATKLFDSKAWPDWADRNQRKSFQGRGLIIWDHDYKKVVKLWAEQALDVLKQMSKEEGWKNHGIIIGEPVTRLSLDKPDEKPKVVLANQIQLSPERAQELFNYLLKHEELLQTMLEEDKKDKGRILADIYLFLLNQADLIDNK